MSYTTELKTIEAAYPRGPGSTILPSDHLKIAYRRYKTSDPIPDGITKVNFVFAHGTGMNKSVWKYHIDQLYKLNKDSKVWRVDSVVSMDAAGHGDSGVLNQGKLGWAADWRDGAKDLIKLVKHEIDTTGDFVPSVTSRNVLMGHSMGGYMCAYAGCLEASLFDSAIAIEPVLHFDPIYKEFFVKRVNKLAKILVDEFPSRKAALTYFSKSFYNVLDKRVMEDFVNDELYEKDGKVYTKGSAKAQLATYVSAMYSIVYAQEALKNMEIPFLHVVGTQAFWNPPDSVEYIRSAVPERFIATADLEGDHLVHGVLVDETVDLIRKFVDGRIGDITEKKDEFPEIKYGNDREKIFKSKWDEMIVGDVDKAVFFGRAKPNL